MAKKPGKATTKRGRGRPELANTKSNRILIRVDDGTKAAIDAFCARKQLEMSSAVRLIVVERLTADGLLR